MKGIEKGRIQTAEVVLRLFHRQVGTIDNEEQEQIKRMSVDQLEILADRLLDFRNVQDLTDWLKRVCWFLKYVKIDYGK